MCEGLGRVRYATVAPTLKMLDRSNPPRELEGVRKNAFVSLSDEEVERWAAYFIDVRGGLH
jgi:hypothetical protein